MTVDRGTPPTLSGKVVDSSALVSWAKGSLAMATWREMAWTDNLTLIVPIDARAEAVRARPNDIASIDYFLSAPNVLTRATPDDDELRVIDAGHDVGVFDPLASWIGTLARGRDWSVLTSDADRLRRVAPDAATNEV